MSVHVLESKRRVACEEAAGNQERCYELFPVTFVSLTSSRPPKGAAATSPKPGCEEQHAPAEAPCFPRLWNNTLSFQMTGKGFQSEIMPRLVLLLTSTPRVLTLASLWSSVACPVPCVQQVCQGLLESPWQRPSLVCWDREVFEGLELAKLW